MSQQNPSQAGKPDTPDSPATATDGAPPADAASLAEALTKAEALAQEHQENWLRARAEADNIRKRAQMDVASAHKYAIDNFAGELLPVYDALDAALFERTVR